MNRPHVSAFAEGAFHGEANTATRILKAAVCEFDELSYADASFGGVAARSGFSKSLVNYHFPTKGLLAAAVLNLAYPGGVFMGENHSAGTPVEAILSSAKRVSSDVMHNPVARAALKLRREATINGAGSPGSYSGWLARTADRLHEARRDALIGSVTDIDTQARLLVSGVAGLISVASATGNYLCLTTDVVTVTQERLSNLGAVIEK